MGNNIKLGQEEIVMDNILTILGNILMIMLAMISLISSIFVIRDIKKSKELKDIRNIRENLANNTYLMENLGLVVSKSFIYGHKNTGNSPCNLKKLEIDDAYSLDSGNILMDKEIETL